MIKMSESDLYSKLNELEQQIQKDLDDVDLAKDLALYNFIKHDLLGD